MTLQIIKESSKYGIKESISVNFQNENVTEMSDMSHMTQLKQKLIIHDNDIHNSQITYVNILQFILYFLLYVISIIFLIIYVISESLPNNNSLHITPFYAYFISCSISFVIAFNSSIITPRFITSAVKLCKCSNMTIINKLIMFSRTMTTIIIPLTLSFILLNNCGNYWTKLWIPCNNENNSTSPFNVTSELLPLNIILQLKPNVTSFRSGDVTIELNVLSHSQVCKTFYNIDWNKCIRMFLFKWCNVLVLKIIIMFFIPIFIILYKTIINKIYGKNMIIFIDSEYTMIVTKLEIILSFGLFCPLLYILIIVSLNSLAFF
eukprot:153714_1